MEQIAFDRVVSRGCGLDVHQKTVVVTIQGEGIRKETREFGTFTSSLTELRNWLLSHGITHVAMERTGVYWKPVYHILEPTGMTVWIVNARHIKYVPGHKTDRKDSAWLCKLLLAGLLKPSYIPPWEQRELRDLTCYRKKLIESISANKNRIIRILEDCNIKLSSVLSDTGGVVGTKLIDCLIDGKQITPDEIDRVYHRRLHASKEELLEACNGYITEHHVFMLQTIRQDTAATECIIFSIDVRIRKILAPYDNVLALLKEIPGLGDKVVEDLVAEIGLDMSVFPDEKHLCSWVGIAPGNNESAGKKSGRITHGNQSAETAIVEAAWAATRTKNTFYSARYHRLAARRGKKRALIAVGHSILKSVYHILNTKSAYRELGADHINLKTESKRRSYLKKELEKLGYEVLLTELQTG